MPSPSRIDWNAHDRVQCRRFTWPGPWAVTYPTAPGSSYMAVASTWPEALDLIRAKVDELAVNRG